MLVGEVHGRGQRLDQLRRLAVRQRLADDFLFQAATLDVFHGQERPVVVLAHLMDLHDVRVLQPGSDRGFLEEPCPLLVPHVRRSNHLQGDDPVQLDLPGLVDHPHAAAADFFKQLIRANPPRSIAAGVRESPQGIAERRTETGRGVACRPRRRRFVELVPTQCLVDLQQPSEAIPPPWEPATYLFLVRLQPQFFQRGELGVDHFQGELVVRSKLRMVREDLFGHPALARPHPTFQRLARTAQLFLKGHLGQRIPRHVAPRYGRRRALAGTYFSLHSA